jgi:hypothetical protein
VRTEILNLHHYGKRCSEEISSAVTEMGLLCSQLKRRHAYLKKSLSNADDRVSAGRNAIIRDQITVLQDGFRPMFKAFSKYAANLEDIDYMENILIPKEDETTGTVAVSEPAEDELFEDPLNDGNDEDDDAPDTPNNE